VSSCMKTCTPTTDAKGAQTVSYDEPKCSTTAGCSVTASTSTTTLALPSCTSSCSTCYNYQGDGEDVPEYQSGNDGDDVSSGVTKRLDFPRSVAGRVSWPIALLKRARSSRFRPFQC
jgi:hypothetical protein